MFGKWFVGPPGPKGDVGPQGPRGFPGQGGMSPDEASRLAELEKAVAELKAAKTKRSKAA